MAVADFDLTGSIRQTRSQTSRAVEYEVEVDFSSEDLNDGNGLAATKSVDVFDLPAGYVHDYVVPIPTTLEGEAATLDIGDEDDADGFGDGVDLNGTANKRADLTWSEAYLNGEYFPDGTTVRLTCPAGANTIDVAKVRLIFKGFIIN